MTHIKTSKVTSHSVALRLNGFSCILQMFVGPQGHPGLGSHGAPSLAEVRGMVNHRTKGKKLT